jgi:ubiquinone/menaquinone biosynthesis C-methylase UbiE
MSLNGMVSRLLSQPRLFQWQQRLCNNYGAVREHFATYLDVSGKDILDIGCSTGNCASTIVPMARNRYVGIDIAADYIELARKQYPAGSFLHMNARKLTFKENSFDVVTFIASLHHMSDELISACLKEVRRVLRTDGVVLCAEPVFTKGRRLSTLFLNCDRGKYIRAREGYQALFHGFHVSEARYFDFSIHRFCSFILRREAVVNVA